MVTEDFADVGGPAAVTGGAPFPGERPFGRPMPPNAGSRGAPGGGLLLLLANGGMAPLPEGGEIQMQVQTETSYKGYSEFSKAFHCHRSIHVTERESQLLKITLMFARFDFTILFSELSIIVMLLIHIEFKPR